jgi:hypothetical protein
MKWRSISLARVILCLAVVMIVAGFILHGVRPAVFQRGWENMLARPSQSLALRFLFQPAVSAVLAIRDGVRDARTGRSPYFWTVLFDPAQRSARLREAIAATGKVFLIALVIDVVYQLVELKAFYPGEALFVGALLAFIPYLILRGPVARLARRLYPSRPSSTQAQGGEDVLHR